MLLNCFLLFFIHLKVELLAQFPALNGETHMKNRQFELFDQLSINHKMFFKFLWHFFKLASTRVYTFTAGERLILVPAAFFKIRILFMLSV